MIFRRKPSGKTWVFKKNENAALLDRINVSVIVFEIKIDPPNNSRESIFITRVNRYACEMLGYKENELLGKPVDLILEHGIERSTGNKGFFCDDESISCEIQFVTRMGKKKPVLVTESRMKKSLPHRNIQEVVVTANDLSELIDTRTELKRKNRELTRILYIASHDLRGPLLNIEGWSRQLESETGSLLNSCNPKNNNEVHYPDSIRKNESIIKLAVNTICTNVIKMSTLIDGLLKLYRAGNAEFEMNPVNMNNLIKKLSLKFQNKLEQNKIDFQLNDLPGCMGDENQIERIFSHLIANSIKYRKKNGSAYIRITGRQRDEDAIYCVEDNGLGIAKEDHEKIFKIFEKLDPGASGSGLGMGIISKIIEKHSGEIWLESEKMQGTRFFVKLLSDHV